MSTVTLLGPRHFSFFSLALSAWGGGVRRGRTKEMNVWIDQCQEGRPWHQGLQSKSSSAFNCPDLGTHSHIHILQPGQRTWGQARLQMTAPAIYPQTMSEDRPEGEED